MAPADHVLELIQNNPDVDLLLRSSFDFDIHRKYHGDGLRLASGEQLFAGGANFLCA